VAALTIDDFGQTIFEHDGKRQDVYRLGTGPAVIVMAELPGITPNVLRFAGWVSDVGCTALATVEHQTCGGPGVGAVGMCFTGGYALAMATNERVIAPVLSQPSMPLPIRQARRAGIDCSSHDLAIVKHRCAAEGLRVLGLRFKGDRSVPAERFRFLREALGDAFVAIELDDSAANPDAVMRNPHSVLTEHLVDEPGTPTRQALHQVLDLFRRTLITDS
jgi:dienelactone hydrolase